MKVVSRSTSAATPTSTSNGTPPCCSNSSDERRPVGILERHPDPSGDRRLRRAGHDRGRPGLRPPAERIAVFDNDGTLWCEKPMPIELGFILQRLAEMATRRPSLRDRQPWKAAVEQDYAWLGGVDHQALPRRRQRREGADGRHPPGVRRDRPSRTTPARPTRTSTSASTRRSAGRYRDCGYLPMVELLRYLEANGFTTYIASGGDRDFMRPVDRGDVRHPAGAGHRQLQRPCATSTTSTAARVAYARRDGRVRRRPGRSRCESGAASAAGRSSPAATPTATSRCCASPAAVIGRRCACCCCHDDAEREFDYTAGAEQSLERAAERGLDGDQHQGRLVDGVRRRNMSSTETLPSPVASPCCGRRARRTDVDGPAPDGGGRVGQPVREAARVHAHAHGSAGAVPRGGFGRELPHRLHRRGERRGRIRSSRARRGPRLQTVDSRRI